MRGLFPLMTLSTALLAGCGGKTETPQAPPEKASGVVRLGMTPDEVAEAAGVPDRTTNVAPGDGTLDIHWTYRRHRHLVLKGEGETADRDFPAGCILVFGHDGQRLTEARNPAIR